MATAPSGQTRTATLSSLPPLDTVLLIGCAIAVTVPLTMTPWTSNAFELPKVTLLRALVLVLAALAVTRILANRRSAAIEARLWLRHPLVVTVLAFSLALFLSTLGSTNPRLSVWGSYERQQGLLTLLAYLALFFITAVGLRTRPHVDLLWRALVWVSAPVVLYGLLQALRLDPLGWQSDAASPVLSTVGRSNFLGTYLVLIIPLTWGQLVVARARAGLLLLSAGQLTCLALTHARGAWLGLAVTAAVCALLWTWTSGRRRVTWYILGTCLLVVVLISVLGVWQPLADLVNADGGSVQARLTIWQAVWPLLQARPWFGYGPETLRNVFVPIYPPQLVYYQGRQTMVDRAHNLWLDLGLSSGLAGLVTFATILFVFGWLGWRSLRAAKSAWTRVLWTALLAALSGHLVDLLVSFEVTTTAAVFWLLLAMAAALTRPGGLPDTDPPRAVHTRSRRSAVPTVFAVTLAFLLWLPLGPRLLWADAAYWQAQQSDRSPPVRLAAAQRAVQLNPSEPFYRLGLAARWLSADEWSAAVAEVEQALALAPHDPTVWAALGDLEARWGEQAPTHRAAAVAAYRRAIGIAPHIAAYHAALGLILVQDGQLAAGTQALQRAVELDASDGLAFLYLGDAHFAQGQVNPAKTAYERAIHWNPKLARAYAGLARCYTQLGNAPAADAMWTRAQQLAEFTAQD